MNGTASDRRPSGATALRRYGDTAQAANSFTGGPSLLADVAGEVFAAEVEAARRSGNLGYMARILAQVTLPHSRPNGSEYVRRNGHLTLSVQAPSHIGLPYGGLPRMILSWLTTEAVRTHERTLVLGPTLTRFMAEIGLVPTGGRWGTIPRFQEQIRRLFAARIFCSYDDHHKSLGTGMDVASYYQLWWDPKEPTRTPTWQSTVILGEQFFQEVIERPVPIDTTALRMLKRSPLALDLYFWMTHRFSYLDQPTTIPWTALHAQFGADYERTRDFRAKLSSSLKKVSVVYPEANFDVEASGIRLLPSRTHVGKLPTR
jgi:hypothetical protein